MQTLSRRSAYETMPVSLHLHVVPRSTLNQHPFLVISDANDAKISSFPVKLLALATLVPPKLEYAVSVWVPHQAYLN